VLEARLKVYDQDEDQCCKTKIKTKNIRHKDEDHEDRGLRSQDRFYLPYTYRWGTNLQSTSSSALLKHYHWLTVHQRIQFKIACIIYKTVHTTQPAYLNSVLEHYTPTRTLRSSDTNLLSVPRVRTCFGFRSFFCSCPHYLEFSPF